MANLPSAVESLNMMHGNVKLCKCFMNCVPFTKVLLVSYRFCKAEVSPADLSDHIERLHVASQRRNSRVYKCYWEGCKVSEVCLPAY